MSGREEQAESGRDRMRARPLTREALPRDPPPDPPPTDPAGQPPPRPAQQIEAAPAPDVGDAQLAAEKELLALLTHREREVLVLIAQSLTAKQIGRALGCAEGTVYKHRAAITRKTGLRGSVAMSMFACRTGLVQP